MIDPTWTYDLYINFDKIYTWRNEESINQTYKRSSFLRGKKQCILKFENKLNYKTSTNPSRGE